MKKFIMTFENAPEERAENAQALAEQIDAEVYEGGKNLWDNLVAICEQVPEGEGVVIAEDDVKISSKFNPVEGDEIINYFYNLILLKVMRLSIIFTMLKVLLMLYIRLKDKIIALISLFIIQHGSLNS